MWYGLLKSVSTPLSYKDNPTISYFLGKSYDNGRTWVAYRMWQKDASTDGSIFPWNFGTLTKPIYELPNSSFLNGIGDWTDLFNNDEKTNLYRTVKNKIICIYKD